MKEFLKKLKTPTFKFYLILYILFCILWALSDWIHSITSSGFMLLVGYVGVEFSHFLAGKISGKEL